MKEIFDHYIENSFADHLQADFKLCHFEYNYRKYFPAPGASVLDIGIGRGEMLSCMKKWGMKYEGVDISPSAVRFCQSLGLNCLQVDDTAAWLRERPDQYELVTALDVIEHVSKESLLDFLKAIKLSLQDGGRAIFQVPNLQSPFGYLHHFNDITHLNGFVEHSLGQVLQTAGFEMIAFHGFEELVGRGFKTWLQKKMRWGYWRMIRGLRALNSNPNPNILHPVFYAIAVREQ